MFGRKERIEKYEKLIAEYNESLEISKEIKKQLENVSPANDEELKIKNNHLDSLNYEKGVLRIHADVLKLDYNYHKNPITGTISMCREKIDNEYSSIEKTKLKMYKKVMKEFDSELEEIKNWIQEKQEPLPLG